MVKRGKEGGRGREGGRGEGGGGRYKCPYMVSRCSMSHTHTTSISTFNGGHISIMVAKESSSSSPLVGLNPTTHSTILSSTDREGC